MGIDGLLRQLGDAMDNTHLQKFKGQKLVVDALSWLHKACYGCAFELSTGRDTDKYIRYMLRKVEIMRGYGVAEVILVFDGQRLPLKSSTQEKRQRYKEENRKQALQAMAASKRLRSNEREDEMNKAYQLFQRSVSITPTIIYNVMNALRAARIPFVVAPFEADAQMAWMCNEKLAAGIVTEDSDVFVYCLTANVSGPVLVKLEDDGSVQVTAFHSVLTAKVTRLCCYRALSFTETPLRLLVSCFLSNASSMSLTTKKCLFQANALLKKVHFLTSGEKEATRMFVQVCVLAGCDFLSSLPNMGFATAVKHIYHFRGAPASLRVQRLVSKLSASGTKIPSDYMQQFLKAETIFYHHIIFNSSTRSCEFFVNNGHFNCYPDILQRAKESLGFGLNKKELTLVPHQDELHLIETSTNSFLGQIRSRAIVEQIYKGEICARTLCSFLKRPASSQIWNSDESKFGHKKPFDTLENKIVAPKSAFKAERKIPSSCQKVSEPCIETTAQRLVCKKRSQTQERTASIQSLMSAYKTTGRSEASTAYKVDSTLCASELTNAMHASSLRILSSTPTVVNLIPVTAIPIRDVLTSNSKSIEAPASVDSNEVFSKIVPQSALESRKRPRPELVSTASCAGKFQALASKKVLSISSSKKTLFDYFHKLEDNC